MKKVILGIILSILFINTRVLAFDRLKDYFEDTKLGTYSCPQILPDEYTNTSEKCVVTHFRSEYGVSNCGKATNEQLAKLIKSGRCQYKPDMNKYYSCQYAKGSCFVTISEDLMHSASCMGEVPKIDTVVQNAKNGKCMRNN